MRKCFKSVLALVLALSIVFVMAVPSLAADVTIGRDDDGDPLDDVTTATATVWYRSDDPNPDEPEIIPDPDDVIDTYTVTIPNDIKATKTDAVALNYNVVATNVLIHPDTQLQVHCAYNPNLYYRNTTGDTGRGEDHSADTFITYKMQTVAVGPPDVGTDFASKVDAADVGPAILTVTAGTPFDTNTTVIRALLTSDVLFAGLYSDPTVVFSCAVVDIP